MIRWTRSASGLFCLFILMASSVLVHAKPPLEVAVRRQQVRNDYVRFETMIDSLEVQKGMHIVDIGSGPGYASFLFAEKLQGTGAVYATDIREDFIAYIAQEAKRRGLDNVFPVVVTDSGLDDFYAQHRFDIVFASNVYHSITDRISYFSDLGKSLNPGARLVLIMYNQVPLFTVDDLYDLDGIIHLLSRSDSDDPFIRHLSSGTKQLIAEMKKTGKLENAVVGDFNRMLQDPHFYENFYDGSYFAKDLFDASERELANWLLMGLKEEGVLDKPAARIDAEELRTVMKLNRLFFQSRFSEYLANKGMGAYIPASDANRHTGKYEMFRELGLAGYSLVKEVTLSAYFDGIIMERKTP